MKDKKKLDDEGILAIEADDPNKVIMLMPTMDTIKTDDLIMSLFHGLNAPLDNKGRHEFAIELHRRLSEKEKESKVNF